MKDIVKSSAQPPNVQDLQKCLRYLLCVDSDAIREETLPRHRQNVPCLSYEQRQRNRYEQENTAPCDKAGFLLDKATDMNLLYEQVDGIRKKARRYRHAKHRIIKPHEPTDEKPSGKPAIRSFHQFRL